MVKKAISMNEKMDAPMTNPIVPPALAEKKDI